MKDFEQEFLQHPIKILLCKFSTMERKYLQTNFAKKITTVTVVWICVPNNHKNFANLSLEFLQELLII